MLNLIVTPVIFIPDKLYTSGTCNPSMGIMLFKLLPVVSLVLGLYNLDIFYKGKKEHKYPMLIHVSIVIIYSNIIVALFTYHCCVTNKCSQTIFTG